MRDKEFTCSKLGTTSLGSKCKNCDDFRKRPMPPAKVIRFDEHNLAVGAPGKRFNVSIIEHAGGYLYSWRHGWWECDIWVQQLDRAFTPIGPARRLDLRQQMAWTGREDARLFRHKGQLHIWYTGVARGCASVCFARLNETTLATEDRFAPHYPKRRTQEKNWSFFDHGRELYCVYNVRPHQILRVDASTAKLVHETNWAGTWSGGHLRGGASPVLVGKEYYHWFHGYVVENAKRRYTMGLYTFENKPPFRVLRYTPDTIEIATSTSDCPDNCVGVVFPGGAVLVPKRGDQAAQWCVAMGVHDRWGELRFYDAGEIEKRLVPVQ